jgi:hypothetical protein
MTFGPRGHPAARGINKVTSTTVASAPNARACVRSGGGVIGGAPTALFLEHDGGAGNPVIWCRPADQACVFRPLITPYMACTRAMATKPTMRPTNTIMIGSNIVVNFLMRPSSSRSK